MGEALLRRKAFAEVVEMHAAAKSGTPGAGRQVATALRESGKIDEAIAAARRLREANPADAWASWFLADTFAQRDHGEHRRDFHQ